MTRAAWKEMQTGFDPRRPSLFSTAVGEAILRKNSIIMDEHHQVQTVTTAEMKYSSSIWKDVGITGLKTVLDNTAYPLRRIIWLLILLTCFSLMVLQSRERLNYYLSWPVSTSVRNIRNDSLLFPSVTICPYRDTLTRDTTHLNPTKLRQLYKFHFPADELSDKDEDLLTAMYRLADIYDVRTLWSKTGWDLNEEITECQQAKSVCSKPELMFTVLGQCLLYRGEPVTKAGTFYGFSITLCFKAGKSNQTNKESQQLRKYLDKFYLMISDPYATTDIQSLTHSYYLQKGWTKDIALSLREFREENIGSLSSVDHQDESRSCTNDRTKTISRCVSLCFQRTVIDKIGCRMPYMDLDKKLSETVPYCNSSKQLQTAEDVQKDLLWDGRDWNPAACQCGLVSCSQSIYETYTDSYTRNDDCAQYQVFFADMTYEEIKEEFAYSVISLLCDIGGTLGLLLGASALTMVQFMESLVRQLMIFWHNKKFTNKDEVVHLNITNGSQEKIKPNAVAGAALLSSPAIFLVQSNTDNFTSGPNNN